MFRNPRRPTFPVVAVRKTALIDREGASQEQVGEVSLVLVADGSGYRPADLSLNGSKSRRACAD